MPLRVIPCPNFLDLTKYEKTKVNFSPRYINSLGWMNVKMNRQSTFKNMCSRPCEQSEFRCEC